MKSSVIVFPGSNCDRDIAVALEKMQFKNQMIWHKETKLPKSDLIVLPGGFSYGDYLRSGAIAGKSLIIDEVNSLARQKDIQEAADAMVYLEKEMEDYTQVGIQASIGQLIESQLKTKMLANVRENYLLDPIDSPMLPDMKSKPYRTKIVIIGTLIGFVLSLLITIIMSYGFGKRDRK